VTPGGSPALGAETAPSTLRTLGDTTELRALAARYLAELDAGQFDRDWAAGLFTDDVELRFPMGGHAGVEGVAAFTHTIMDRWANTHHHGSECLVHLRGDEADVEWSLLASHIHTDSPPPPAPTRCFQLGGRFRALARRTPAGWRFARLVLRIAWTSGAPPAGIPRVTAEAIETRDAGPGPGAAVLPPPTSTEETHP
jgi:hypothetical protein